MGQTKQEEKRRYTRVIFNEQNKVQALISLPYQPESQGPLQQMPASVLNMSEGGLQVSVERKKFQTVEQGDNALLTSLTGVPDLVSLTDIPVQIIWIMDNEYLEHILLGISFFELSERQHKILRFFVEHRLTLAMKNGEQETIRL
ncbi:MAG: PilZ domain-containing protein [Candidatus Electrothrix sp. AU1_5]|nr:PilZ domain-containing protein [Candidatus Electrothrix gigas]